MRITTFGLVLAGLLALAAPMAAQVERVDLQVQGMT